MSKLMLKKLFTLVFGLSVMILPNGAEAASAAADDECSQEVLLSYFPTVFVTETLNKFKVPKDKWDAIKQELMTKDKEIIKLVEAKAAKITPNPLKDPEQRQTAIKLFRETLTESFTTVMKKNGITDDKQIQLMLEDLQIQKAKRFAHCMEIQRHADEKSGGLKKNSVAGSTGAALKAKLKDAKDSDDDEDDDDSNDSDDDNDDDNDSDDDDEDEDDDADAKKPATPAKK